MAEFPYSPQPAKIKSFFATIQGVGVPPKVNLKYLESLGFKSSNDRYSIGILKFIGFLEAGGIPSDRWRDYRSKLAAPKVLAVALRVAYEDLFNIYEDAYRKDDEVLRDYFSARTTVAARTQELMVGTFRALCELADFGAAPPEVIAEKPVGLAVPGAGVPSAGITAININIQLTLPPTDDPAVYDNLFAALKKHLLS